MYFRILKKYLSAYILPIFKKANVNNIVITLKNIIVLTIIGIWTNNIPTDITLTITYNICLNDK